MKSKVKSIIYVLSCVLLWSLIPVVSKIGQTNLDNHQFLFWSSVISLLIFIVLILIQNKTKDLYRLKYKGWIKGISLGFLGTYLYYILLYYGYAKAKGIEVLIIQYSWPIFVILLSVIILKEKIDISKIISIVLGFAGVFLVLTKGDLSKLHLDNIEVDIIVVIAAFIFGLFSVLSKKVTIDPLILVFLYFLAATIFSFLSMVLLSEFKLPTFESIIPILVNGVFVNGISYMLWIKALKNGNASFIAPFVFFTPVISTFLLILFFKEPFYLVYIVGMSMVIIAGLINRK